MSVGDATAHATAATHLRETADAWNANIERWLYVTGTPLAQLHGVDGYYVRVAEPMLLLRTETLLVCES